MSTDQEIKSFPLGLCQAVNAVRSKTQQPMLQLMAFSMGFPVMGKEAIETLMEACQFALDEEG